MKSLSFLAELYLGVGMGQWGLGWSVGIQDLASHVGHPSPTDSLSPNDIHSEAQCILHGVRLALGQLDGFIELVQGALEVCDLWGKAWSVLPCEDPTLLPPTRCSLAIRQP